MSADKLRTIAKTCLCKWTYEAMLCHRIGGVCSKCPNRVLESGCVIKYVVILLVRKFGVPQDIQKIWRNEDDNPEYKFNTWLLREEGEMLQQDLRTEDYLLHRI